jgi:hypothetical protein
VRGETQSAVLEVCACERHHLRAAHGLRKPGGLRGEVAKNNEEEVKDNEGYCGSGNGGVDDYFRNRCADKFNSAAGVGVDCLVETLRIV